MTCAHTLQYNLTRCPHDPALQSSCCTYICTKKIQKMRYKYIYLYNICHYMSFVYVQHVVYLPIKMTLWGWFGVTTIYTLMMDAWAMTKLSLSIPGGRQASWQHHLVTRCWAEDETPSGRDRWHHLAPACAEANLSMTVLNELRELQVVGSVGIKVVDRSQQVGPPQGVPLGREMT